MIDHMIVSLFELLSKDMKSTLLKNLIEDLDTNNYVPILYLLVAKTKGFSSERLRQTSKNLPKIFLDLQEHPSIRNWKHLVRYIRFINPIDLAIFYIEKNK